MGWRPFVKAVSRGGWDLIILQARRQMEGSITGQTAAGKGTKVVVRLPLGNDSQF